MSFLQPILLIGLPLALLPVIIHLINQHRHRTVRWAAMIFLLDAKKMTKGLARLRQILILTMRVLAVATLVFAALGVRANASGLAFTLTGRTLAVAALCAVLLALARRFDAWDMQQWLWETWRFVKMIFPLLVVGVFLVGIIRVFIRPEWVEFVAGSNTVLANLAGVVFGVFMYFPTLVEVPIAKMFLSLGMHPGPLIAYLMAYPVMTTPALVIDEEVKISGRMPSKDEIAGWLKPG